MDDKAAPADPVLELDAVRVTGIVEDVTLSVPRGGVRHLLGPSGCGKTTLLRVLARLVDPDGGVVRHDGLPLGAADPIAHRRAVALVPQTPVMLPGDVRANLRVPLDLRHERDTDGPLRRAEERLARLGISGALLAREASRLSVGERQRVALVRALVNEPRVLLLDEVTAALDDRSAAAMLDLLLALVREDDVTLVHVSHRLDHVRALGGRLVYLEAGRVREEGAVPDVLDAPETPALRAFLRRLPQDAPPQEARTQEARTQEARTEENGP